ncbi:MAG: TetR family transcriptional regulator [Mycobacterium sp.]|jgi:AcrR family transcriptional regulator|nr:TetR family transcriptional regulator [Mycobacterium sp.]
MRSADLTAAARIRDAAIELFGQHGFGTALRPIAEAAGVSAALVIHHFGSKEGLRKACDNYVTELIRDSKTEALQSMSPATWFAQLAEIDSYAPVMAYLMRSLQSGGELAKTLMQRMIDNAEDYIEEAVRAGTIKPSRDPKARAKFLAMASGGGFLLYLQTHENPTDLTAVLRDYGEDMIMPALELYTYGLMADTSMYDAFVAQYHPHHKGDSDDDHTAAG